MSNEKPTSKTKTQKNFREQEGMKKDEITIIDKPFTEREKAFISSYVLYKNGSQAVREAGYRCKDPDRQASVMLARPKIRSEIQRRLDAIESKKIADANEVLQFYTSVMRGEILDQFGIEASLDTRIKAANELAKHRIEIPMKLEQKNITNNIGTIQLNFLPRMSNNVEEIVDSTQNS